MSHLNLSKFAFSSNYCPITIDLSGNTVWPQASGFPTQHSPKWTILAPQNVNVARFARNVECDFLGDFQTLWYCENTMEKLIPQQKANLYTFVFSELFDICNFTEKMVSVFSLVAILLLICTQLVTTGKVHRCQLHLCAIFQPNNFRRFSREKKVVQNHSVFAKWAIKRSKKHENREKNFEIFKVGFSRFFMWFLMYNRMDPFLDGSFDLVTSASSK